MDSIFPGHWLPLSHDMRELLAKRFDIKRSSFTEVSNNKLVADGRTPIDLQAITRAKMAEYVGEPADTELPYSRLWELTQSKANAELNPISASVPMIKVAEEPVVAPTPVEPTPQETLTPIDPKKLEVAQAVLDVINTNPGEKNEEASK